MTTAIDSWVRIRREPDAVLVSERASALGVKGIESQGMSRADRPHPQMPVSQFGAVHVGHRVSDGGPVLSAGREGLLDLDAALALGATAGGEPVDDIASVVAVGVIVPPWRY